MNTHFNVSDQELAAATGGGWGFLAKLFIKQGVKQGVKQGAKQTIKKGAKRVGKNIARGAVGYGAWEGGQRAVRAATGNNSETDA